MSFAGNIIVNVVNAVRYSVDHHQQHPKENSNLVELGRLLPCYVILILILILNPVQEECQQTPQLKTRLPKLVTL
jgi:hypothetical protein